VLGRLRLQLGVTLIELMVGIAVFAILLVAAMPSFTAWMQNSQIRVAADAIQNGLQMARGEAIRRNTTVRFQMTDTSDNSCALSVSGKNWVVSLDDATGLCASAASDTVAPRLIQMRPSTEGTPNAVVAADQASIVFNSLGRVIPVPAADININVTNPTGGDCATAAGPMRCLRVVVSTGGQVRMCDPGFASTDPQGC
jgi:type IV fimbrial biogenesis protein FimT